uniref:U2A'/phosphoprotein 32 family A C-terminal domain-containing protein n=2 Tax=Phlebotomus papatasi TaxID=29031 RepID=A0A1B0CYT0_PHLPP
MPHQELPSDECLSSSDTSDSHFSLESRSSSAGSHNHLQIINEYANFLPEEPLYEPIVLPTEPSLEELLHQVTGAQRLDTVQELKLRVISHLTSLQRIHAFVPCLVSLNLDGSIIHSLRDLGCHLNLRHLNVSRCGLRTLDGTSCLVTLEELIADGNSIEFVEPCYNLPILSMLSLKDNRIGNFEAVAFLALCPKLRNLNLTGNPVETYNNYRERIKECVPQLRTLDGSQLHPDRCGSSSSSECYSSSLTSPEESLAVEKADPDIAEEALDQFEQLPRVRPSTAGTAENRSANSGIVSGAPVCGNIISMIRRQRKKAAWGDSEGSTDSSSSRESPQLLAKSFPMQLPQSSVDLELGISGTPRESQDTR